MKEIDNILEKQERPGLVEEMILVHPKVGQPFYRREMVRPETFGYKPAAKSINENIKAIEEQLNFIGQNARRFSHLAPTQQEGFVTIISRAHKILGYLGRDMYEDIKQKKVELGAEFHTYEDPMNPMGRARNHLKKVLKYIKLNRPILVEKELSDFSHDYTEALHKFQEGSRQKIIKAIDNIITKSEFFKEELKKYSRPELKVFVVDGQYVRENMNIDFTEGGHHEAFDFIPENEIWLDLDVNVREIKFVLLHELIERRLMKKEGLKYNSSHTEASKRELNARQTDGTKIDNLINEELDKLEFDEIKTNINKQLKRKGHWEGRHWVYDDPKDDPRIRPIDLERGRNPNFDPSSKTMWGRSKEDFDEVKEDIDKSMGKVGSHYNLKAAYDDAKEWQQHGYKTKIIEKKTEYGEIKYNVWVYGKTQKQLNKQISGVIGISDTFTPTFGADSRDTSGVFHDRIKLKNKIDELLVNKSQNKNKIVEKDIEEIKQEAKPHQIKTKLQENILGDVQQLLDKYIKLKGISKQLLAENPVNISDKLSPESYNKESLRRAIISEYDAISLYSQLADMTENEKLKEILLDIAQEEKIHVGEFEDLLNKIDPEHFDAINEGKLEINKENILNRVSEFLNKAKIYVGSPQDAPEGASIQRGPRGGLYYEEKQISKPEKVTKPIDKNIITLNNLKQKFNYESFWFSPKITSEQKAEAINTLNELHTNLLQVLPFVKFNKSLSIEVKDGMPQSANARALYQLHLQHIGAERKVTRKIIFGRDFKETFYHELAHYFSESESISHNIINTIIEETKKYFQIHKSELIEEYNKELDHAEKIGGKRFRRQTATIIRKVMDHDLKPEEIWADFFRDFMHDSIGWPRASVKEYLVGAKIINILHGRSKEEMQQVAIKAGLVNEIKKMLNKMDNLLEKSKVYLTPEENPPKGVSIQTGKRGGRFYEGEAPKKQYISTPSGARVPPAWTNVWITKDPNSKVQATGLDSKGRKVFIYSAKFVGKRKVAKFNRLKNFTQVYPKIIERIEKDKDKNIEEAVILYLISKTGFRIGSDTETKAEVKAYGASTLRCNHLKISGDNKITFDFIGKKGVHITKTIKDEWLANKFSRECPIGKDEPLFHTDDYRIRKYLNSIPYGSKYNVKDFRTYIGTNIALREMRKLPKPESKSAFRKFRNEIGDKVAQVLGNTRTISLGSYVAPEIFENYSERFPGGN